MKRLIILLCLMLVVAAGLSSCAVDAYPGAYYGYYDYGPYYYGHSWRGGYYRGDHDHDRGHHYGERGGNRGGGHHGERR